MTQRKLNLWSGSLNAQETHEVHRDIEANFTDLYTNLNLLEKNFEDEEAAARAGIPYGALYRTDAQVFVRITHMQYPITNSLQLQAYPPQVRLIERRFPGTGSLTFSGVAPRVIEDRYINPPAAALSFSSKRPQLS